ncbi:MAG: hypothetical protein ACRDRR_03015 [Pseudonocardiaceae bacterium]
MTATTPPVLPAYRDGACLRVWCAHEAVWHIHGGCNGTCAAALPRYRGLHCECPPGTADGLRAAHCTCPRLRAQHAAYTLREVGPFTAAVRRAHGAALGPARGCGSGDGCRFDRAARRSKPSAA